MKLDFTDLIDSTDRFADAPSLATAQSMFRDARLAWAAFYEEIIVDSGVALDCADSLSAAYRVCLDALAKLDHPFGRAYENQIRDYRAMILLYQTLGADAVHERISRIADLASQDA